MAIGVGSIVFTGISANSSSASTEDEFVSFTATGNISAGETIVFHNPESGGDNAFSFTVGTGGLSEGDRVTISEDANVFRLIEDPSGNGSVSLTTGSWSISGGGDNIIATSFDGANNVVIAAINVDSNLGDPNFTDSDWQDNISQIPDVSTTAILAASPFPVTELTNDTALYKGTDFAGISNLANWEISDGQLDYDSPNVNGVTFATQDANLPCFLTGTRVATRDGSKSVETLVIGDLLKAKSGDLVKVLWVGARTVSLRFNPSERLMPVRVKAGALGDGLPQRDLTLTSDHALLVDGLLINAGALVNGTSINWVPLAEFDEGFTVYHIETEAHEVILAEGAPAETFIDYVGRQAFDNYAEYVALYGEDRTIDEMPLPRISAARLVPAAVKAMLCGEKAA